MPKKKKSEGLSANQKEFITNRVKELGSFEKVEKFYNNRDEVSQFAIATAATCFQKGKK